MTSLARYTNGPRAKRAKSTRRTRSVRSYVPRAPSSVSFGTQVLPRVLNNTLKYCEQLNITTNASGFGSASFRANGIYDPVVAVGGHQPLGYDQLSTLYDHWYVKSSRIVIQPQWAGADVPVQVALYVDDDTNLATTWASAAERPGSVWNNFFIGDGASLPKLKNYYNSKKTFGAQSEGNPELKGAATSDPQEQAYFAIVIDGGANLISNSMTFSVEIQYDVEWTELATFATS